MPDPAFVDKLNEQIGYEFGASQQYVANAVYYDNETLPRLAAFFYAQAIEERNHAMMMVQYLMDADAEVVIPGIEAPRSSFGDIVEPVVVALEQEKRVTGQINALAAARPRARRLLERAVHAVVHQGADRGGRLDVRPPARRRALAREPAVRRGVPRARAARRTGGADATAPAAAGGAL